MNALEDTRELVTTTSAPDTITAVRTNRSRFIAGFVDDLLYKYPDVELSSIRITELDGIITVTGRRGPITDECPSCHTTAGHPHTDYCTLTKPLTGNTQIRDPQPTPPVDDLVGHLRDAIDRARERRTRDWCSAVGGRHLDACTPDHCGATPEDAQRPDSP